MKWINKVPSADRIILAGDIGGTNANLALVAYTNSAPPDKAFSIILKATFNSKSLSSLVDPIQAVLEEAGNEFRPDLCCVSAAGPVSANCCLPTNLTWQIDGDEINRIFSLPTVVINDFEALGYSLPVIDTTDTNLVEQLPHPGGNYKTSTGTTWAVTGAGTGLGLSSLALHGGRYIGRPSEGGHADFAPFDEETRELKQFITECTGIFPDSELFLSGRGMAHIFLFLVKTQRIEKDRLIDEICKMSVEDIPPMITKNTDINDGCKQAMKLFFRIYGRFAGNAALYILPYAGMFLAGGIVARHTRTLFEDDSFMQSFEAAPNEVMKTLLQKIPVFVIKDYATSLVGAANAALSILQ